MPAAVSVFGVKPFRIGGTETFARELSAQLGARGWQSVLCFLSEPPAEVRDFLTLPNVALEVLPNATDPNWPALKNLARILRTHRPAILHLHYTGFLSLYPWLARCLSVERVFFTDHSSRPAGYVARRAPVWKRTLARAINRPLTKVVSVSNYGYQCLTRLDLLPRERYELVYNGVDLARVAADPQRALAFRRKYAIPDERAVVLQVSWIIPEKGIADLLAAAQLVLAQNRQVQFVLVGEGANRAQYMQQATEMGIGDHVTWTGLVQDPFGAGVYDVADIVCQVSRWEEVFGWMIAEAMTYSKPVVATRVGGIPELIDDGVSGFLVARGDTNAIAEKIITLLADPALRAQMGRAGCLTAHTKFNLQQNVTQLIKVYGV
ncbi:MAG TPA: glycosyltransferase family 4 protein [Pyrinomonadaceae bacterium]|jgi:glycosyltransferase involved in cell wall biosynthesis